MTCSRSEILERVQEILDKTYLKVNINKNVIEVFIPTRFGWKKELVIGNNEVELEGGK